MDLLRVFLFAGLVLHKLVWEILKTGNRADTKPASPGLFKRIVKYGKIGVLFFLIAQTLFLELLPIMNEPASLRAIGAAIFALWLAIAITGRAQLGKNWANLEDRQVMRGQQLVQAGIYRYIRHPIYSGDMLLVLSGTRAQLMACAWRACFDRHRFSANDERGSPSRARVRQLFRISKTN